MTVIIIIMERLHVEHHLLTLSKLCQVR